jgi:integrase
MPETSHTGPRWITTDTPGLVKESRSGIYHLRRNFSQGPGRKPKQVLQSLATRSLAEAKRRFEVASSRARLGVEKARGNPLREDVAYWRKLLATDSADAEASFDSEIEKRLGPELGSQVDPDGTERPVYDPRREAKTREFVHLVQGRAIPVDFYLDDFLSYQTLSPRYVSRIRLAVRLLVEFLRERPRGNTIGAVDRRTASDFLARLIASGGSTKTMRSKRSALSSYWSWLVERGDAEENFWPSLRMPRAQGKSQKRGFTKDEMIALLQGTTAQPMSDFIRVAALTGMRLEEIGALTIRDCADGWFRIRKGKNENAVRSLPIHSALLEIVARRTKDKAETAFLFDDLPKSARARAEKMGQQFTAYRRRVGVIDLREDGLSWVDFHSFRRWFITEGVRHSGHPEWIVSEIVGHSTGRKSITLDVYFDGSLERHVREVVESVRLPVP